MDDIISYDPFFATYVFDGVRTNVTFTCPFCGSHSCRRVKYSNSNNFFEGGFRCLACNAGSYKGEPFNYYSSAFITEKPSFTQLTLF